MPVNCRASPTGVGRYLADLCGEWSHLAEGSGHRFILYSPARPGEGSHVSELQSLVKTGMFEHRAVAGRSGTWWEQLRLPPVANRDRLDVFFAPAYSAPMAVRAPVVLTIHDMSFAAHPEWFRRREGLRRRWLARRSARRAAIVVTVSEFARREIVDYLDLPPNRVRVVRSGVKRPPVMKIGRGSHRTLANPGEHGSDDPTGSTPVASGSNPEPLVLFVGSIFNRRHLPDLIEAFARVTRAEPHARLTIVGENRSYPRQDLSAVAATAGVADQVAVLSYVTEDALSALLPARAGVRVPLGIRGLWYDTARSHGRGYSDRRDRHGRGTRTVWRRRGLRSTRESGGNRLGHPDPSERRTGPGIGPAACRWPVGAVLLATGGQRNTRRARECGCAPAMTELAIVIVNHNTRAELEGCLRSLHAHPPLRSYDTILVDNASSDGSVEAVRAAWPDVRVIEAGGNLGFARANNLAIRASASELILLSQQRHARHGWRGRRDGGGVTRP